MAETAYNEAVLNLEALEKRVVKAKVLVRLTSEIYKIEVTRRTRIVIDPTAKAGGLSLTRRLRQ
jgi:hypothetical protein